MYEKCPNDCDSVEMFSVYVDTDNNAIIYECAICDWVEVESDPFYLSAWIINVNQALAPIDIFQSLLTNKNVVRFLRPKLKGKSYLSRQSSAWEFTVGSDTYLQGEVDIAYQTYLNQMIVLAATYIEVILKDFFRVFSQANPSLLIGELAKNKNFKKKAINVITFDNVMEGEAKEALIKHFFALSGQKEYLKIVKHLAQHAPINSLNLNQVFDRLHKLIKQRNDIVHDDVIHNDVLDAQQIYNNFSLIIHLLYILEMIAAKNDIYYWKEFEYELDSF